MQHESRTYDHQCILLTFKFNGADTTLGSICTHTYIHAMSAVIDRSRRLGSRRSARRRDEVNRSVLQAAPASLNMLAHFTSRGHLITRDASPQGTGYSFLHGEPSRARPLTYHSHRPALWKLTPLTRFGLSGPQGSCTILPFTTGGPCFINSTIVDGALVPLSISLAFAPPSITFTTPIHQLLDGPV